MNNQLIWRLTLCKKPHCQKEVQVHKEKSQLFTFLFGNENITFVTNRCVTFRVSVLVFVLFCLHATLTAYPRSFFIVSISFEYAHMYAYLKMSYSFQGILIKHRLEDSSKQSKKVKSCGRENASIHLIYKAQSHRSMC